jgi:hypothetical protein
MVLDITEVVEGSTIVKFVKYDDLYSLERGRREYEFNEKQ